MAFPQAVGVPRHVVGHEGRDEEVGMTERIDSPSCIRSKASLISSSGMVWVIRVDVDLAVHVPVDDLRHVGAAARAAEGGALPDAAGDQLERPRAISCPAPATPMMIDSPQPRWQHSSAWRITLTLPMHSKL
jgi:hypothetical protein